MSLEDIDNKLSEMNMGDISQDEQTKNWKYKKPAKMKRLEKSSDKKPDHVLIEYLTQRYTVRRMLVKIVAGNIVVIDNKVHILNPRDQYRDGKYMWYKMREIDRLPISNRDYDKLIKQGRITVNDAVVIKAIVGAIQKKEMSAQAKKWIVWLIILGVVGLIVYIFFFAK